MTETMYDAIVIGSGLGGLSAAAHLAAVGRHVLLLERYSVLGGSSHVFRRGGKWEFDCGVHYIGHGGPEGKLTQLFAGLGLDDRVTWLPLDPDGFDIIDGPGLRLPVPVGWDRYRENLLTAFPEDARGLTKLVGILRSLARRYDRDRTPMSTAASARWLVSARTAAPFALAPLAALFTACRLRPRTALALGAQCGALGTTPLNMVGAAYAMFLDDYVGNGAYYPRGGGQVLAAAFAEVILAHGGEIRRNASVDRIRTTYGAVTGVTLENGECITAPAVVAAGDIVKTFSTLIGPENLSRHQRSRVAHWTMSQPLINGFFGVECDLTTAPNANFYAIPSWADAGSPRVGLRFVNEVIKGRSATDGPSWARQMAARMPMFVQSSSRRDPLHAKAAPPGHATIEVQTIVPSSPRLWGFSPDEVASRGYRDNPTYREVKRIVTDAMLERMEQVHPGASSRVRVAELGTPATQERYVGNTGAATFGLEVRASQMGPLRPGVTTSIRGLYLAGTSTRWGPGTLGAMLSGRQAASAIVGRDLSAEVEGGAVLVDRHRLRQWDPGFDALAETSRELDRRQHGAEDRQAALNGGGHISAGSGRA